MPQAHIYINIRYAVMLYEKRTRDPTSYARCSCQMPFPNAVAIQARFGFPRSAVAPPDQGVPNWNLRPWGYPKLDEQGLPYVLWTKFLVIPPA